MARLDMDDNMASDMKNMDNMNHINEDDKPSWYSYISNYIYTLLSQIKKIWTHNIYPIYITHKKLIISGIIILLVVLLLIYKYRKYIMDFIYKKKN
jgi:hypothetical protein